MHCQVGAASLTNADVYNWLKETLNIAAYIEFSSSVVLRLRTEKVG